MEKVLSQKSPPLTYFKLHSMNLERKDSENTFRYIVGLTNSTNNMFDIVKVGALNKIDQYQE